MKIIAIDFDDTIAYSDYSVFDNPVIIGDVEGAKEYINKLYDDGYFIIIYTCRNCLNLSKAIDYLKEKEIKYSLINANHPANIFRHGMDTRKIYADYYIDDHQIGGLPPWKDIYNWIINN